MCKCSCGGRNHGRGYQNYYLPPTQSISLQTREELAKRARDEAVNEILLKVEASGVVHQPHIALLIEGVRQSYNHHDYLYDVAKELLSSKSVGQKLSRVRDKTVQEIKKEAVSRLTSG